MTVATFNPLDPQMAIDPHPFYRELRETEPGVHQIGGLGMYVLTRYADVAAFYKDRRLEMRYATREQLRYGPDVLEQPWYRWFGQMAHVADNPHHRMLRAMFQSTFTPPRVRALRPHMRQIADGLLDAHIGEGGMEFMSDFAEPFPRIVIGELLGIPAQDNERIGEAALRLGVAFGFLPMDERIQASVNESAAELMEYFAGLAEQRRSDPADDLFTAMLQAAAESGGEVSDEAMIANAILLYIGGHETTSGTMSLALLDLHRQPDQLAKLTGHPELVPAATEELLRFSNSAQGTGRIAAEDVEYGGVTIPAGSFMIAYPASANRDAAVYERPDELDLERVTDVRLLTFGPGPHQCVGHALSRLELEVFLEVLVERLPRHTLSTLDPEYREFVLLRGAKALEMTW
jgi:cytochrome P450